MSGGVDSSVAAALLLEQGYEVIGITMQIWPQDREGACCSLSAVDDARRVANKLGIPYYVSNFQDLFAKEVIADFCSEYQRGRTPNPCIRCNEKIKFSALLKRALELDADYLATGHYVQLKKEGERHLLYRARDQHKDQSYVLAGLRQEQLKYLLFPLGTLTKDQTRTLAEKYELPVAHKAESQEICFVPNDDYRAFLKERIPQQRGEIVDTTGQVLGNHSGIVNFTIGQRRNLGLGHTGQRYFVLELDPKLNRVIVGKREELFRFSLLADNLNFIPFDELAEPLALQAQVRYNAPRSPAVLIPQGNQVRVDFELPQSAITPGQAVVFYQGELVVGGGTIAKALD
jgi:tRNA-specific 2-thiouridylase